MGERRKILLIEDDPDVGLLVLDVLSERGVDVTLALDPERLPPAISPDLILTDLYGTPWYDRDLAASHVAMLRDRFPGVPVVVLTAYREARADLDMIGADAIVAKPFDVESLTQLVTTLAFPGSLAPIAQRGA